MQLDTLEVEKQSQHTNDLSTVESMLAWLRRREDYPLISLTSGMTKELIDMLELLRTKLKE